MYKMDSQKWVEFQVGGGGEFFLQLHKNQGILVSSESRCTLGHLMRICRQTSNDWIVCLLKILHCTILLLRGIITLLYSVFKICAILYYAQNNNVSKMKGTLNWTRKLFIKHDIYLKKRLKLEGKSSFFLRLND